MSVTAPRGFRAGGIACGIKPEGVLDLALIAADGSEGVAADGSGAVPAAGVFTTNKAAAAPVRVSRTHLEKSGGRASAVVINSGNANAATGVAGMEHAWRTAQIAAASLGREPHSVLICSTGLIGIPLPFAPIEKGLPELSQSLGSAPEDAARAARAIMTTDTRPKETVITEDGWTVGGMAKGAAMLEPAMATMLAVLTTDAVVDSTVLRHALVSAVECSFNQLVVDGATSTNDTALVLASGASGVRPEETQVADALGRACADLAGQMVADAEGGTKVARITVTGALSDGEALRGARQVASSLLVKCSLHGEDPYWGRIVSELGSAGIDFDIDRVTIAYGGVAVCRAGSACPHDASAVADHMAGSRIEITADLGLGSGAGTMVGTDISHAYIDENVRTS